MTEKETITYLLGSQMEQYEFVGSEEREDGVLVFRMTRREDAPYVCAKCGQPSLFAYDTLATRLVEDIPWGDARVFLEFAPRRVCCPHCHVTRVEVLSGMTPMSRQTDRFRLKIARWCEKASISQVAEEHGLDGKTVRRIDKEFLERREAGSGNPFCEMLGIDEIAIRKGHVYSSLFYDHARRCVIEMVEGRKRDQIEAFFKRMGPDWCAHVRVVTCDLWKAYKTAVRKYLHNAVVVTDKFHVFQYASAALDELRRSEHSKQKDRTDFDLKKCRFLILKANSNLDDKGKSRIEQLKEANTNLYAGYLLKEQVFTFYGHEKKADAESHLCEWATSCVKSGLKPFVAFGKRLLKNKESILAYFDHRISNGFAEGINNKVKVIKRMAFGFHDFAYFRLKVFAATGKLPPLPRRLAPLAA